MGLFSILRRPSYNALSLAVRTAGSASTFHRAISTVPTFTPDLIRTTSIPPRRFSTAAATEEIGNDSLIGAIESHSQIKSAKHDGVKIPVLPDEFPFEIIDNDGENTILLKREFEGETIQVGVDIPHVIPKDWDNDDDDYDEKDAILNDDAGIPMVVNISKENGLNLEFGVTGFEMELCIDSLSVKQPGLCLEEIAYDGPEFHDLAESLQNAWYKYLDVRGISANLTCFLYDYMRRKKSKEHLIWLKNVKGFIEK